MAQQTKFQTLYLHIGLGKTGTTAIQRQLMASADMLEPDFGIHYPRHFPDSTRFTGNHSTVLRALFCKYPPAKRRLSAVGLHTDGEIAQYNKANRAAMHRAFQATTASQLLLSAESVSHFTTEDLADLAAWGQSLAHEVKLVACVRNPVHALPSEIQQRLKIGAKLENLYDNPPFYRFQSLFEELEQFFGRENIIAYSFHRALENSAGLAAELLKQIGSEVVCTLGKHSPANSRISLEATLLLNAFNHQVPAFIEGRNNPQRTGKEVQRLIAVPGKRYEAPGSILHKVQTASKTDTDWLQSSYPIDLSYHERDNSEDGNHLLIDKNLTDLALKIARGSNV